jgi:hypothetical protein
VLFRSNEESDEFAKNTVYGKNTVSSDTIQPDAIVLLPERVSTQRPLKCYDRRIGFGRERPLPAHRDSEELVRRHLARHASAT